MAETLSKQKPIQGHEKYHVTSNGDIISYVKYAKGVVLKRYINSRGYYVVCIDGVYYMVHRLVAEAFVENPNKYKNVLMKNGNKLDCNADNLIWSQKTAIKRKKTVPDDKPVYKYTLDNKYVDKYDNILDASLDFEKVKSACVNIRKVCFGESKTFKGYKWSFDKPEVFAGKLNITKGRD